MKLAKYLKPYWYLALLSPIMMIIEVLVDLKIPELMATIIDKGVIGQDMSVIVSTGIEMLILVVIGGIGGISCSYFASAAAQNFSCDLRNDTYKQVMALSLEQTDKFTTGSLITRLTNDVTAVQDLVANVLRMFVRAPMFFIGGIFMIRELNVRYSIVLAIAMPLELILVVGVVLKASPMFQTVQKKLDNVNSVVQEDVAGARVIKAFAREDYEIDRFDKVNVDYRDTSLKVQKILIRLGPIMSIIMNFSIIAIIIVGGQAVRDQLAAGSPEVQVGAISAAITYVTQILSSLLMISMMFQSVSRAAASGKRIIEILDSRPTIVNGTETEGIEGKRGEVVFSDVSFRYPDASGRDVLQDIDLTVHPGEFVAILGATGCGKSTLVNLIPRFYDVTSGFITVDGRDIREYDIEALRSKISIILQKSELFSGTVLDNIRYGMPDASEEDAIEAAKIAQADEFIVGFNDGYQTMISEKGASLSGGQKQRMSIARGLLRKPEILIFDDSTSALDLGTEAKLRKALRESFPDTTIIMIAQRIASVTEADRIAVLEDGVITACAPHEEMMRISPAYVDIYNSQLKKGGEADA